jgi:DNA-3-methyladenine glycosylase
MTILPQSYYVRDTPAVARDLLGCYLVHLEPDGQSIGRIVETEAYLWDDSASHSFRGQTGRNRVMFGPAGHAYIYFIYGMYYCFNVVTGERPGEAVLIRALEPVEGIPRMADRRGVDKLTQLCSGPAKLVQALGITPDMNGSPVFEGLLQVWTADSLPGYAPLQEEEIVQTTRVGIQKAKDLPLRFYAKNCPFISRK